MTDIEEGLELVNRATALRRRQFERARRSPESHWRLSNAAPPGLIDLDRAPIRIATIEVEFALVAGDAHVNRALDGVEIGFGVDHVER